MPIIKSIIQGGKEALYHTVSYVEYYHKAEGLAWRGKFQSFSSAGPVEPPLHTGVELGIPVSAPSLDPIRAFEEACVADPSSTFYGGEYTPPGTNTSLALEKVVAWARVKTARDVHLDGGVDTPYGRFDSDLVSIVNILGAKESMLENSSMPWIRKDYSQVSLSKVQIGEIGNALAAFRAQGYGWGSALHSQIDAASTVEAVRAISWTPPA